MKSIFQPWKIIIVLVFLMIFSSLFAFIYSEQVKLPSEGWSNAIEIDAYEPNLDYDHLSASNTFAVALDDLRFANIVALGNKLIIKSFSTDGTKLDEALISFPNDIFEISGAKNGNVISLIAASQDKSLITFIQISSEDFSEIARREVSLENMDLKLSAEHVTAFDGSTILVIEQDQTRTFHPAFDGRIEKAESFLSGDDVLIAAITMKTSTYNLWVMNSQADATSSSNLYILPSLSAIRPVNVAMAVQSDKAVVISTMKHSRFNTNYVDFFEFTTESPEDFLHSGYEIDTFEAIPYLIQENDGTLSYLINFWASSLGRTEIAKDVQAYPNLFKMTHGSDEIKQLTKSERSSVKPSYLKMGDYDYLIHNEQSDAVNRVYISSSNPKLIAESRDYSSETLFDIFMRTITTYPALILAGIPPLMTIILPLLVITVPILMFKLNWAEQNHSKMTLLILAVFTVSKLVAFGVDIFPSFNWPPYLEPSIAHWGAFLVLSALTFLVYLNRKSCKSSSNEHFLKSLMFYVVLDLLVMITFFLPYTII